MSETDPEKGERNDDEAEVEIGSPEWRQSRLKRRRILDDVDDRDGKEGQAQACSQEGGAESGDKSEQPEDASASTSTPPVAKRQLCSSQEGGGDASGVDSPQRERLNFVPIYHLPCANPLGLERPAGEEAATTYRQARKQRLGLTVWHQQYQPKLPYELLSQCAEDLCELCGVPLSSDAVATSHYWGRNHEKAVDAWLEAWSDRTRQKRPRKKYNDGNLAEKIPQGESETFCRLCSIELTSRIVALTHYRGKNHAKRKKLMQTQAALEPVNAGGDDAPDFGADFAARREHPESGQETPNAEGDNQDSGSQGQSTESGDGNRRFFCVPCQLECDCEKEYVRHVWSSAHKSRAFSESSSSPHFACVPCGVQFQDQAGLEQHESGMDHALKMIRGEVEEREGSNVESLEGGAVRCKVCDIQCTGMENMQLHLRGKQHAKKLNLKNSGNAPSASNADALTGVTNAHPQFWCELCHIATTDMNALVMHRAGKKHLKRLNQTMLAQEKGYS